ncbi:pilus assembly protein TadG-related protein [Arthrobacter sp. C9C5]|uniref:pilus assembly protein TadG-related protein n=1 Tax=Arthrobacter sp. C9C5 TaxID=2735267 RepID=UPI001584D357|nr:pilus assembly protein TadG-related protein [Arthrobacter sp. C9C5]NUU30398.1 hypothetical protein [Arthrobacter sp. C9C5]
MQRLRATATRQHRDERGATGVLVAVMMLVLIGAGALAVDTGQIYAERAQLQNAADAGALAAAQQCHRAGGCTVGQAMAWAAELSGPNSDDGATTVDSVDLSVPNQIKVVTSTRGSNGAGFLTKLFASALNAPPVTVRANAIASFRNKTQGSGFPLALSDSCFNLSGGSQTAEVQKISYKPGGTCTGPSGTQIPGGWGWLDRTSPCIAETTTGNNRAGSDPGNNPPTDCDTVLGGWIATILAGGDVKVAFPVFDNAGGQGQNGYFHVIGYATFKMWGWKFGNNHNYEFRNRAGDPNMTSALACSGGNNRCIIGQFVTFETIDSIGGNSSGGANLGTAEIKLIK